MKQHERIDLGNAQGFCFDDLYCAEYWAILHAGEVINLIFAQFTADGSAATQGAVEHNCADRQLATSHLKATGNIIFKGNKQMAPCIISIPVYMIRGALGNNMVEFVALLKCLGVCGLITAFEG